MPLNYESLDETTRKFMQEEVEKDTENGTIYLGSYLNEEGRILWPSLLLEAAEKGDDASLAAKLRDENLLKTHALRAGKTVSVPVNAADTLSEGEFNRYYARGVCLHAISNGGDDVTVYRARTSSNPRRSSEAKIGLKYDPEELLKDLRENPGVDTALGLPNGPNSGLSVKL
ncbi:hypothetical protein [Acetobacter oryzifermentans]|uniref:Uncharacterized protein n=1 Tax=Acetobacter oryzifermentans TaxID=1633874 RepID=A0ABN4NNM3_9PROT|nr:hypothetical protein [Acetobacter oryzifermentans]ANA13390.1 hypothetical protein WG31_04710 [Acetobacter oryzifermentans]